MICHNHSVKNLLSLTELKPVKINKDRKGQERKKKGTIFEQLIFNFRPCDRNDGRHWH